MIVDIVSDLHGCKPALHGGDLLIVAGDLTKSDKPIQYGEFAAWIDRQNYKKKVLIAGNHDNFFEKEGFEKIKDAYSDIGVDYLCDSGTTFRDWPELKPGMEDGTTLEVKDYKIWGIPWSKRFVGMNPHCMAFTYYDETWLYDEKVMKIPVDVDILITHSPPYGILDEVKLEGQFKLSEPPLQMYEHVGSTALYNWLKYVGRPRLHVFGHIHEAYGQCEVFPTYDDKMMISVNASIMNENYQPVNKPVRVIL